MNSIRWSNMIRLGKRSLPLHSQASQGNVNNAYIMSKWPLSETWSLQEQICLLICTLYECILVFQTSNNFKFWFLSQCVILTVTIFRYNHMTLIINFKYNSDCLHLEFWSGWVSTTYKLINDVLWTHETSSVISCH